ncbi:MAG TPA: thioredoxin domain-containing protein [Thermoanaerobaculia bacterium]|nr:thioredoxin domain-containing protein [Thermoanaerobaculia bacterium]
MTIPLRRSSPWAVVLGFTLVLVLGSPAVASAKKGPKISVGNDPSMKVGSPSLVLVELSDFQCFYCGRAAADLLPRVHEAFVKTGKVEIVFLDLPLQMHPQALKAAEAAACAGAQDKFWDMHNHLFANQEALTPGDLVGYAQELGLDVPAFQKCLSGGRQLPGIREDLRIAQSLDITGTPAFLIGRRVPDSEKVEVLQVLKGLPPYEVLAERLEAHLGPEPVEP